MKKKEGKAGIPVGLTQPLKKQALISGGCPTCRRGDRGGGGGRCQRCGGSGCGAYATHHIIKQPFMSNELAAHVFYATRYCRLKIEEECFSAPCTAVVAGGAPACHSIQNLCTTG